MTQRKRLHPELRRQQIVAAAIRVFFEMGYEGASLRDLAAQVGINKATVYHYFASKEEILYHILREVGGGLLEGVRRAAAYDGNPLDALEAMIRFQIEYMEDHLEEVKVLVEEKKSLRADLMHTTRDTESEILRLYKDTAALHRTGPDPAGAGHHGSVWHPWADQLAVPLVPARWPAVYP